MWTCPILQPLFQLMSTLQKMGKWKRRYFWPRGKISRLKTRFNSPLKAQIVTLVSSSFISFESQNSEVRGKKLIFKKVLNYQIEKKVFWPLAKISRLKTRFNSPLKEQIVTLVSSGFLLIFHIMCLKIWKLLEKLMIESVFLKNVLKYLQTRALW